MITVEAMHLTPVKSLGLVHPTTVHVGRHGIAGSVSKVDMATRMPLIYKIVFPSISTFETPPNAAWGERHSGRCEL